MNDLALIVGVSTGLISIATAAIGIVAFIRSAARKQYASERDFNHLRNNQKQLEHNMSELWRQNDQRLDAIDLQLNRIETFLVGHSGPPGAHWAGKSKEGA